MAKMFPESIPSNATRGEQDLFDVLRDKLPDDFYVWYEPGVKGLYPDFIILGRTFGLLVIEVKGWDTNQIISANNNKFEIIYKGQIQSEKSPLYQGKDYLDNLRDELKKKSILTHRDGEHKGKLIFPVNSGAVMSNMTSEQAQKKDIYKLLKQPQVAYKEELMSWNELDERELIKRLENMCQVKFYFPALTPEQISTIKGVIYPEMVVSTGEEHDGDCVIRTLDDRQESLARSICDGHRIIYGVAGSGKTLILLSRAKILANKRPERRILILCINISLAGYMKSLLHEVSLNPQFKERIEVMPFTEWSSSLVEREDYLNWLDERKVAEKTIADERLGQQLLTKLKKLSREDKWDSVLVDEAHTFHQSWLKCCVAALKDTENGDLMIVADGSQRIYKIPEFTWKSVGIKAVGRTYSKKFNLQENYRNTEQILAAAWNLLSIESSQTEVTFPIIEGKAIRKGDRPVLHIEKTTEKEVEKVIRQIQELKKAGYAEKDIAVLYREEPKERPIVGDLIRGLEELGLNIYWVTKDKPSEEKYRQKVQGIRIITTLSALGLDFKAVLILWVQQFADCLSSDSEKASLARKQLYVAMTRARDVLHVFGSGDSDLLEELQRSGTFAIRSGT